MNSMTSAHEDRANPPTLKPGQVRTHREFHAAIAFASGIPRLGKMVNSLHEEVERFMNANSQLARMLTFGDMDHHLLDAISDRDGDKAKKIASESVDVSRQSLVAAFMGMS